MLPWCKLADGKCFLSETSVLTKIIVRSLLGRLSTNLGSFSQASGDLLFQHAQSI